jgi:hypothetical protein
MESKLVKLKTDFNNIINVRTTVKNIFDILQIKINKLKMLYNDFIKTSKSELSVFGLDSFHFQNKLIDIEYHEMLRLFLVINNRMYCEYYKLYGMVLAYLDEIGLSYENKKPLLKPYPVYKDLEPSAEYDIGDIENIFSNLMIVTNMLSDLIAKNNAKIEEMGTRTDPAGFSMTNYVNAMKNENLVIQGQSDMFANFLSFFLASQQRQWDRVHRRMMDFADYCSFSGEDSEPTAPDSIANISVEIVESVDPVETERKIESSVAVVDPLPPKKIEGMLEPEMSFE